MLKFLYFGSFLCFYHFGRLYPAKFQALNMRFVATYGSEYPVTSDTFPEGYDQSAQKLAILWKVSIFYLDHVKFIEICMQKHTFWNKEKLKIRIFNFLIHENFYKSRKIDFIIAITWKLLVLARPLKVGFFCNPRTISNRIGP